MDKAFNLKDKIPDLLQASTSGETDNPEDKRQGEIDTFIQEGVSALEIMSFANYELNARRRECIKADLNEEYTSLFSASVPIYEFLFGGDTSKRLEEIDKTNKVVKKAMGQSSYSKMRQYKGTNFNKNRGRNQMSYLLRFLFVITTHKGSCNPRLLISEVIAAFPLTSEVNPSSTWNTTHSIG